MILCNRLLARVSQMICVRLTRICSNPTLIVFPRVWQKCQIVENLVMEGHTKPSHVREYVRSGTRMLDVGQVETCNVHHGVFQVNSVAFHGPWKFVLLIQDANRPLCWSCDYQGGRHSFHLELTIQCVYASCCQQYVKCQYSVYAFILREIHIPESAHCC